MLQTRLKALGQLKGRPVKKARSLLQLCHAGKLRGGLSIALDVTPDEAFAPLTHAERRLIHHDHRRNPRVAGNRPGFLGSADRLRIRGRGQERERDAQG